MPDLAALIDAIVKLETAAAAKAGDETRSIPGTPAPAAAIAAAEKSRGRKFHRAYREFLKLHDGWPHFAWGMSLRTTAELTGAKYDRGFIDEMDGDDRVTAEVDKALVIGWSEDDASLILLTDKGDVLEWRYEVECRHNDFTAFVASRLKTLRGMAARARATERDIAQQWTPKWRAASEAALAKTLRALLAKAPRIAPPTPPKPATKRPAAVKPATLVVKRKTTIAAEVMQHLVLYLGAFPTADETIAAYHAWASTYPANGTRQWMAAGDYFPSDAAIDDASLRAALRVRDGAYGLRFSNDVERAGGPVRYVLNVVGTPPTQDSSELPRSSFCEVIAPVTEPPEKLFELAEQLLAILPVRSGHGGYAAYIWDEDAEPDPLPDVFDWCRRCFGIDIGTVDGWLPGTVARLHGASWLTIVGPAFAAELERAKRLDFSRDVTLTGTDRGTIIRAGTLSLGDVQRGEFPTAIAEVEAAIAPVLAPGYDARSWVNFSGTFFDTQSDDLLPMRSHHATALYLNRFLDPASWLAPTPREQGEAWLATIGRGGEYAKEWAAEQKTYIPSFETLLRCISNAAVGRVDDDAISALEFVTQFADATPTAHGNLLYVYDKRKQLDKAMAFLPTALAHAADSPMIFHNAAWIVFQTGDHARAMKLIEQAHDHGYEGMAKLRDDPDFVPLHKLAAWKRIFTSRSARRKR